ncbi:hypothetical protein ACFLYG_03165 [Chloroflexota bacterium]
MKNIFLSVVVVTTLVAAGIGGTFAGFVDTEVSEGNFVQAGISDLLINGKNDPIGAKVQFTHASPGYSTDFWVDAFNWGVCQGGDLYMHFKDVESIEAGVKDHAGGLYVYDGVSPEGTDNPAGYRIAVGLEPAGPDVWSSEPEKIAEVGGGLIAQYMITTTDPNLMGEDYASGVSEHLDIVVRVCDDGLDGILDDPDDDGNGVVSPGEQAAHEWVVVAALSGKLMDIECTKVLLGFLPTQQYTYIHVDAVIQQIWAEEWYGPAGLLWGTPGSAAVGVDYDGDGDIDGDDFQKAVWPTNALQGDKATWAMLFELLTEPS